MPKTLYKTDENQLMPMFESFVVTQSQLVRSRRILDSAFNRDDLRKSGWPLGSAGLALLDKRLEVKVPRGSELITVSVSHPNPAIAQAAVKAVLDAYKEIELGGSTGMAVELRETALLARQVDLRNELDAKRVASLGLALDYGTDDLDQLYQTRMNTLVQIESSLAQNDLAIAHAEGAALASADPKVQGENEEINACSSPSVMRGSASCSRRSSSCSWSVITSPQSLGHRTGRCSISIRSWQPFVLGSWIAQSWWHPFSQPMRVCRQRTVHPSSSSTP
jgi:hypothetical protein